MSTVFTAHKSRRERTLRKCSAMRAAKERKRLECAENLHDCGGITTDGCMGNHSIRLLAYPDGKHVAVSVDGVQKKPRTMRGVWKCIAKMLISKQ